MAIATLSEESASVDRVYLHKEVNLGGPINENITCTRRNWAIFCWEFFSTNMHRVIDFELRDIRALAEVLVAQGTGLCLMPLFFWPTAWA